MNAIFQPSSPAPDYPNTIEALDPSERTLLLALRWWVAARDRDGNPIFHMQTSLKQARAETAALAINRFMSIAARSASRQVVTHCPCSPDLGDDEKLLLYPASLAQHDNRHAAVQALLTILNVGGAINALEPLEEIGWRFAEAKLIFRRRQAPFTQAGFPSSVESWFSSLSSSTLH